MKSNYHSHRLILMLSLLLLSSCTGDNQEISEKLTESTTSSFPVSSSLETETEASTTAAPIIKNAKLNFVGDILPHTPVIRLADTGEDYDFTPCFRYVKEAIEQADYSVCNLETTLAGANNGRNFGYMYEGYSGYPTFNSPDAIARDLKNSGFDMVLTANNHSLDSFEKGTMRTIEVLKGYGFDQIGTYNSSDEKKYFVKDINGIAFAFINYTYGMNGFTLSPEKDYMVNHWNNYDGDYIDKMIADVKKMVAENADVNIACLHFGVEYGLYPDQTTQIDIANRLFDAGIDVIIGNHSHTLQPFEIVERQGEKKFIIYSTGNFLSNQIYDLVHQPGDFGGMVELDFEQVDDEHAKIKSFSFMPTYCLVRKDSHYILPVFSLPEEIGLNPYDYQRIKQFNTVILPRICSLMKENYKLEGENLIYALE